ncbi:MAG: lamin tail domain-containing protein [Pirellulaceae bacterium]|nr:lamin tail domain-containing protein [Pirellulaceae bacterium]
MAFRTFFARPSTLRHRATWRLAHERLESRRVLDSTVVFNEIMYNPVDEDATMEFIELRNQMSVDMDVSGWHITGGVEYTFEPGTVIEGGRLLVVGINPSVLEAKAGVPTVHGPWKGQLSNGGERIELRDNNDRLMNVVEYDDRGDWPIAADGSGASLEKLNERNSNSQLAKNWSFSSIVGGTPGANNEIQIGTFQYSELIARSSPVTALVPIDDGLGTSWTQNDFDDSAWLVGNTGVGFDLDGNADMDPFIGLDLVAPPNGQAPMPMIDVNSSVYIRVPFQLDRSVNDFVQLEMRMRYDDGFVAYLNGVEWASHRAPGRDGEDGLLSWNSSATGSAPRSGARVPQSFDLLSRPELLNKGENLLAIHGLNRQASDEDLLIDPTMIGVTVIEDATPVSPTVSINEVSGADDSSFLELFNFGNQPVELGGLTLKSSAHDTEYTFPPASRLAPHTAWSMTDTALGFGLESGDRTFLFANDGATVLDAALVDANLLGRSPDGIGTWQQPTGPTPGQPNDFAFHSEIVINEIMYHSRPTPYRRETPPDVTRTEVVSFNHHWRYNESGDPLPTGWQAANHPEGGNWHSGPGFFGVANRVPSPGIQTELERPRTNSVITTYFETEFDLSAEQIALADRIQLQHVIDDGAVFYLNGREILRFNIDDGPVDSTTLSSRMVSTLSISDLIDFPADFLLEGTNRISAEVHQRSVRNTDVLFGARLFVAHDTSALVPSSSFEVNEEEWIELYNRGDQPIELDGWKLDDAVQFEFPDATTIRPDGYLVVAKDPIRLREKHPHLSNIIGGFKGTLSNRNEQIVLLDAAENVADAVHYFDGGHWNVLPDGTGPSLELIDADAENSRGESWSASDEASRSKWQNYTYRGIAKPAMPNEPSLWQEFAFGFLDGAGEALIDDISVIEEPRGIAVELIQNGSFADGTSEHWRLLGNHQHSQVVDDNGNHVLHVIAKGATEYQGNQIETTLANEAVITNGTEYQISFRAKWLTGSQQINSRLYFNRLAQTTVLETPNNHGTPGTINSTHLDNAGPTYDELRHSPTLPKPSEPVTVSVVADDPDHVTSVNLWYQVSGESWQDVTMTRNEAGRFTGVIPGQNAASVVQFYVEGEDSLGALTTIPHAGREARALFIVEDGQNDYIDAQNFRLIMTQDDSDHLHLGTNSLSNERLGATVVHDDQVFYDVGVRLKGSFVGRDVLRVGFNLLFNPDQLFRGVHQKVSVDRSTHAVLGVDEILIKHIASRAGDIPNMYDDIVHFIAPKSIHTAKATIRMAAFDEVYLNSQFENGSDGTLFEYEVIRWATSTVDGDPESLKRAGGHHTPNGNMGFDFQDFGDDKEAYRWVNLITSNRTRDNFDSIIALNKALGEDIESLHEATREVMDIDQWMRTAAYQSLVGPADAFFTGASPHNFRLYVRPDGKVLYLPWDWDSAFQRVPRSPPMNGQGSLRRVIKLPANLRLFYGHMLDIVDRSFNADYMKRWVEHYGKLAHQDFGHRLSFIDARSVYVAKRIEDTYPRQPFAITTQGPVDALDGIVRVSGTAWFDVREIRVAGSSIPLDVTWETETRWQVDLPVGQGTEPLRFEAFDFHGNPLAGANVTINNPTPNPVIDSLRIAELHYNPAEATPAESEAGFANNDFEFVELVNTGTDPILLHDVQLTKIRSGGDEQGLEFDFRHSAVTQLDAGQRIVLVEDLDAFRFRYGELPLVAGQWSGGLSNQSEMVTLTVGATVIQQFKYQDTWYPTTDGSGMSLVIVDPLADVEQWNQRTGWSPSGVVGGSPGREDTQDDIPGDSNQDGVFNSSDLMLVFQVGKYENRNANHATFEDGDWNGDGKFDSSDLVYAFSEGNYVDAAAVGVLTQLDDAKVAASLDHAPLVDDELMRNRVAESRLSVREDATELQLLIQARESVFDSMDYDASGASSTELDDDLLDQLASEL